LRDDFVNGLIDIGHHLQFDEIGDQLKRLAFELLGQVADDDGGLRVMTSPVEGGTNLVPRAQRAARTNRGGPPGFDPQADR